MLGAFFFSGLKIDPAKAAACVASVAIEGHGKKGRSPVAQCLGVNSQLVRSDFQHQLDAEKVVSGHGGSLGSIMGP